MIDLDENVLRICGTIAQMPDPNSPLLNDSTVFPMEVVRSIEILVATE